MHSCGRIVPSKSPLRSSGAWPWLEGSDGAARGEDALIHTKGGGGRSGVGGRRGAHGEERDESDEER
eukprot:831718-Pleurochrysis_carterae.AAC.1